MGAKGGWLDVKGRFSADLIVMVRSLLDLGSTMGLCLRAGLYAPCVSPGGKM